jgi:hypothetical protein
LRALDQSPDGTSRIEASKISLFLGGSPLDVGSEIIPIGINRKLGAEPTWLTPFGFDELPDELVECRAQVMNYLADNEPPLESRRLSMDVERYAPSSRLRDVGTNERVEIGLGCRPDPIGNTPPEGCNVLVGPASFAVIPAREAAPTLPPEDQTHSRPRTHNPPGVARSMSATYDHSRSPFHQFS